MEPTESIQELGIPSAVFRLDYRPRHRGARRRRTRIRYRYAPGDYVRPYRPRIALDEIARVLFFFAIVLVILGGMVAEYFEGEPLPANGVQTATDAITGVHAK